MTESTTTPLTEWNGDPLSETWEIPLSAWRPSPVSQDEAEGATASVVTVIRDALNSSFRITQELEPGSKFASVVCFTSEQEEVTLLEKWEGHVIEILDGAFRARVRNNLSDFQAVEAEFALEELPEEFHSILSEGMPLVWSIVRERRKGGIQRSSILYLRRSPRESESSIKSAQQLLDGWIDNDGPATGS
jgi:hypothetical protein